MITGISSQNEAEKISVVPSAISYYCSGIRLLHDYICIHWRLDWITEFSWIAQFFDLHCFGFSLCFFLFSVCSYGSRPRPIWLPPWRWSHRVSGSWNQEKCEIYLIYQFWMKNKGIHLVPYIFLSFFGFSNLLLFMCFVGVYWMSGDGGAKCIFLKKIINIHWCFVFNLRIFILRIWLVNCMYTGHNWLELKSRNTAC